MFSIHKQPCGINSKNNENGHGQEAPAVKSKCEMSSRGESPETDPLHIFQTIPRKKETFFHFPTQQQKWDIWLEELPFNGKYLHTELKPQVFFPRKEKKLHDVLHNAKQWPLDKQQKRKCQLKTFYYQDLN